MFSTFDGGCRLALPPWRLAPQLATHLLEEAYSGAHRRTAELPADERLALDGQDQDQIFPTRSAADIPCRPSTYGELPADEIFRHPSFALSSADHVLDLGAGDGKLVTTAVLLHGAASGLGIELAASRVADGCAALGRLVLALKVAEQSPGWRLAAAGRSFDAWGGAAPTIELRVGDARTADFGRATTRALMYATCFPLELATALQHRLAAELPAGARVLAAGARGWHARLGATHHEAGRPRWLVNEERLLASNHSGADADDPRWDERPCLGDVADMVWAVVEDIDETQ